MLARIGRMSVAVAAMLILLIDVRPAACEVPLLLRPISVAGKIVTTTTSKVAHTSVAALHTVVSAPKNLLTKVGNTVAGKKSK